MLKITKNPTWTATVTFMAPVDGAFKEQSAQVTYSYIDPDDLSGAITTGDNLVAVLKRIVQGMDDLVDEAGAPLAWDEELAEHVLKLPYIQRGLIAGYYGSMRGEREKN